MGASVSETAIATKKAPTWREQLDVEAVDYSGQLGRALRLVGRRVEDLSAEERARLPGLVCDAELALRAGLGLTPAEWKKLDGLERVAWAVAGDRVRSLR